MNQDTNLENIRDMIIARISINPKAISHLNHLVQSSELHVKLLNIRSCESAKFVTNPHKIKILKGPECDRLSMVFPLSYAFQVFISVGGYFQILYKGLQTPLPQSVEQFKINYSGVIVMAEEGPVFRNENVSPV